MPTLPLLRRCIPVRYVTYLASNIVYRYYLALQQIILQRAAPLLAMIGAMSKNDLELADSGKWR
ncbi:hypothetical protein NIES4071_27500 [Calothrix sp. NIES-4071]|nr:hypothetical protein NIES4071_27500 [Calothrix sp. NIES-4071]BAZ57072.1 hypothetical protein NIES4105_27440 [Calothrix sp. NIES-4105]